MFTQYFNINICHRPIKRWLIFACLFALCSVNLNAQNMLQKVDQEKMKEWVDEQMEKLTPEERLGQLVFPLYYMPDATEANLNSITRDIKENHFGGILLSKGTMATHAKLVNHIQKVAEEEGLPPMMICIDGEWGLAMRLKDAIKYPRNAALGKINEDVRDTLCYMYGYEVGRQCRELGIHVNFAPVLDVNTNPKNPVIGNRSFGNNPELVSLAASSYARGLEDAGVLAVGKHFPGHGDTKTDSHKTLPILNHSIKRLNEVELPPFQHYINQGLGGIMTAHLDVPALAEKKGMPATVSKKIITNVLRNTMHFNGLIFTDGLAMVGAKYKDICINALLAGNDILLQPTPQKTQMAALQKALLKGYKGNGYKLKAEEFQQMIDEKCRRVLEWKYALGLNEPQSVETEGLKERVNTEFAGLLKEELERMSGNPILADYDPTLQNQFNDMTMEETSVLAEEDEPEDFIPPVPLLTLPIATPIEVGFDAIKLGEVSKIANEAVASGAVPGCQVIVMRRGKIVYDQTFGNVGGNKEQNRYANRPVTAETMYDLASLTKALATVPAVMMLIDEEKIRLRDRASKWLPELKGTRYAKVTIQDLLHHESGLKSTFLFYQLTENPDSLFRSKTMIQSIASLPPKKKQGRYLYSDLNFVLLRAIVERRSGERLDQFLEKRLPDFYGTWLCFNPLQHGVPKGAIAPTEQDDIVRHRFIHGTVHDETGAWALGVEGNSGLFGSAEAIAPLIQMIQNGGELNGKRYLPKNICRQFTTNRSAHSRRALGFDRQSEEHDNPNIPEECSARTWGHTGFTGTCFWVDPQKELIYIFLSNRVCPTRNNNAWREGNIRPRIHQAIYDALKK
jgi:beta-glucosidase-like glycosyl hydrolase/CubicO group peptidase (beta-lactamase class C family)